MGIRSLSRNEFAARGWMIRLLLAAVVLRALIPVGFMPDFGAAAKGVFKVVICTAAGSKHVMLDADGKPLPDQKSQHHDQPCAFAGLAAVAVPVLDAQHIVVPLVSVDTYHPTLAVALPPARAGPVLGSRGPPQLS